MFVGKTSDGKKDIYAMPEDIEVAMSFNDAAKAVQKLNSQKAFGHDDWQIPSLDIVHVLYKNQNKGFLGGTFNTIGGISSSKHNWYWSSTQHYENEDYYDRVFRDDDVRLWSVCFFDGMENWHHSTARVSCRPVRLVEASAVLTPGR